MEQDGSEGVGGLDGDEPHGEDNDVEEGEDLDESIKQRIGEWQTRLLQLNRRNNLLYFRPGQSTVEITGRQPDELDGALRRSTKGLRFEFLRVGPTRQPGGFAIDPDIEAAEPEVVPGDLETAHEVGDLQRRLRNLRRKDREWEEEQGLNVLFLALGFLHWVDADDEQVRSPLVLVPCDLERPSPGDPFRLRREDDDPVVNPTLRHSLSGEGVNLPELDGLDGDSAEDTSIELYLAAVDERLEGKAGWYVDSEIVLGTFSYSKLAMYQDLERMKNTGSAGIRNDLVRFLASGDRAPLGGDRTGSAMPPDRELAGGRLDDLLNLRDQFAVLPSDFSQLRAIEQARRGGNLVIHGPPGTGKSQTIANLIATMLADGKRVLFVSEKTAALDVVKRRLEECDLGVFCLDLHSDRGRKVEVYKQLQRSLDDDGEVPAGDDESRLLKDRRQRLNRVTRLLHEKREPLGLSIFEVQGLFAHLRHHLRFEGLALPPYEQLTQEWLQKATEAAQGIALRPHEFTEHHNSRWRALRTPQVALPLADLIRQDMQAALGAINEVRSVTDPFTQWLGRLEVRSTGDVRNVVELLRLLAEAPGVPSPWLTGGAPSRLRQLQSQQAKRQHERNHLMRTLSQAFGGQPPAIDYSAVRDAISLLPTDRDAIAGAAGPDWRIALGRDPAGLSKRVGGLVTALDNFIAAALDWTQRFLEATGVVVSDALRQNATAPMAPEEYSSRAEGLEAMLDRYSDKLRVLDKRFDVSATAWQPWWEAAPFADLKLWATDIHDAADEAPGWVEYREAVAEFDARLGVGSTDALRLLTDSAKDAPAILEHRVYEQWLEQVYAAEPELKNFNRVDHEAIREGFRELDEALPVAARRRVRERGFDRYPNNKPDAQHPHIGALAELRRELGKKRRQKSVRRLIRSIPGVIQSLKPCFMMSPLAVSRYLSACTPESGHIEFDVVIFDEASQVFPEEAVPAIERAGQVIVAGDQHQLPPTTFFLGNRGDDDYRDDYGDDDDSDPNLLEGLESILDVMVLLGGAGIAECYLSVHYRSRCESLIRFSNRQFYDNRLLTFPGPETGDACVSDVYLPDATYDAGGSRTNRGEAERVTEIVFELMETLPAGESVGVVALSRAQADLIEDLIEHGRLGRRRLDKRFREDHEERFFVKNLENVQGDERDHMILSVGYGPTPEGRMPNRFGPINQAGGERRLNVAVTRARRSMTVVHSLLPKDINAPSPGARQLRSYLEYVQDSERWGLNAGVAGTGEPESPFEEAVRAALRKRGHNVESQVGVSGYRIDLAIRSSDGAAFDLGIECDGATYHRSPAARDRDWLRQRVLEGLGWRIHRVWSTAWIKNPEGEIKAVEEALRNARARPPTEPVPEPNSAPIHPRDSALPPTGLSPGSASAPEANDTTEGSPPMPASAQLPAGAATNSSLGQDETDTSEGTPAGSESSVLFEKYCRHDGEPIAGDPLLIPVKRLAEQVIRIVEVEQPVHIDVVLKRLRNMLNMQRVRERFRELIDRAVLESNVRNDGGFLWLAGECGNVASPRHNPDRRIDHVADAELDAGLLLVAKASFGAEQHDLVRETARWFGWRRAGANIRDRLDGRVKHLRESGRLRCSGATLVVAGDEPPGR